LMAVLLVTSIILLLASRDNTPKLEIPDVTNVDIEVALDRLDGVDVEYKIIGQASDTVETGVVISQDPTANSIAKVGSELILYVSTGIEYPGMPDLVGKQLNIANFTLKQYGLRDEQIIVVEEFNEFVDKGLIFNQSPYSGMDLDIERTEVVIYISKGSEHLKMPDLYDLTLSAAQAILMQKGITIDKIIREKTIEVEKGKVYRQTPFKADDNISLNDKVTIYVSDGYPALTHVIKKDIYVNAQSFNYSDVKIVIYDSRYRNIEFVKETIRENKVYPVELVLMPDDIGTITVYLNNKVYITTTVGYND
ncbi:MAG: PASTA domain-containing protein, partial [Anaerovoracaceae bacterium]